MGCNQSKAALLVAERSDASVHHQPRRKTTAVTASPSPSEGDKSATMEPQRRSSVLEEEDVVKSVIDGRDAFLVGDNQTFADTSDSATSSGSEVPFTFSFIQVDEDHASGSSSHSANFASLLELSKGHHVHHPSLSSEEEKNKESDSSSSSSSRSNAVSSEDAAVPEELIAIESVSEEQVVGEASEEVILTDDQADLVTAAQTTGVPTAEAVAEDTTEPLEPVGSDASAANVPVEEAAPVLPALEDTQTEEIAVVEDPSAVELHENTVEASPEEPLAAEDLQIPGEVAVVATDSEVVGQAPEIVSVHEAPVVIAVEDEVISKEEVKVEASTIDSNDAVAKTSVSKPAKDAVKTQAEEVVAAPENAATPHPAEATETKAAIDSAIDVPTEAAEPITETLNVTASVEIEASETVATVQAVEPTQDVAEAEYSAAEAVITPEQPPTATESAVVAAIAVEAEQIAAEPVEADITTIIDAQVTDDATIDAVAASSTSTEPTNLEVEEPPMSSEASTSVAAAPEVNPVVAASEETHEEIPAPITPIASVQQSEAKQVEADTLVENEETQVEEIVENEVKTSTSQLMSTPEVEASAAQVEVAVENEVSADTSNEEEKATAEESEEVKTEEEVPVAMEAENPVDVETKVVETAEVEQSAGVVDEPAVTAESAAPIALEEPATIEEKTSEPVAKEIAANSEAAEDVAVVESKPIAEQDSTKMPEPEAEIEAAPSSSASATVDAEKSEAVATQEEEEKAPAGPLETYSLAGSTTETNGSVKYQIQAASGRRKPIQRRYSEFSALHAQLQAANLPHSESLPTLPSSGVVNLLRWRANDDAIKQRERKFRALLDHINEHPELAQSDIFQNFVQEEASV